MNQNREEARMALYDYFVDTLVDLADPEEGEEHQCRDDMMSVVTILFEGAGITTLNTDDGSVLFECQGLSASGL